MIRTRKFHSFACPLFVCVGLLTCPTDATAQEPVWSFRVGGAFPITSRQSAPVGITQTTLRPWAPALAIDLVREIHNCCLEVFVSGVIPFLSAELSANGAHTASVHVVPNGLHLGFMYRLHMPESDPAHVHKWVYAGAFVGGYSKAQSEEITLATSSPASAVILPTSVTFPGGFSIGGMVGFRWEFSEIVAFDANVKLEHLARSGWPSWNPITPTAGLMFKLF